MAEALVAGGATLDPRYLGGAAGPLLEWLELRVPESFERQLGDRVTKRLKSLRSLRSRTL